MGFERFQMDSIFPLGAITVALSALLPRPSAPATAPAEAVHVAAAPAAAASAAPAPVAPTAATAAAAAAGGAYTDGEIEQLLGKLNWDSELVSMDDIQNARTEAQEAYETLCRCVLLSILFLSFTSSCIPRLKAPMSSGYSFACAIQRLFQLSQDNFLVLKVR